MSRKAYILVVDDTRKIADYLTLMLRLAGYRAESAASALECVSRIRTERPDLILMDVMMPGMDGATAAGVIHETPELRGVPIVLLTALPEDEIRVLTEESGAAGYMLKPFRREPLLRKVEALLSAPASP